MRIGKWHELLLQEFDKSGMSVAELARRTGLEVRGLHYVFSDPPIRSITVKRAELVADVLGLELVPKRKRNAKAKRSTRKPKTKRGRA